MIAARLKTLRGNARQAYDLALAGAIGAVFGLFFYVELIVTPSVWVRDALAGTLIGGAIGYALSAAGPLRDRAWLTLARVSSWGAIAGALGGAVGLVIGEVVLGSFKGGLIGRAASWAVLGLGIGLGQGIAYRSVQKLVFGLLGGGIGGFVGGWLFESLRKALGDVPNLGQGVGIACLGAGLGLGLALVEQALRRAWVQVLNGRQEGRSYLLGRGKSALGLDERAAVGLFGDPNVARAHAEIESGSGGFNLRNLDPLGRTKRNGQVVANSEPLTDGDTIELGNTRLVFRNRG
jgi:hypothetical protein